MPRRGAASRAKQAPTQRKSAKRTSRLRGEASKARPSPPLLPLPLPARGAGAGVVAGVVAGGGGGCSSSRCRARSTRSAAAAAAGGGSNEESAAAAPGVQAKKGEEAKEQKAPRVDEILLEVAFANRRISRNAKRDDAISDGLDCSEPF
jgi:hypothetical protein